MRGKGNHFRQLNLKCLSKLLDRTIWRKCIWFSEFINAETVRINAVTQGENTERKGGPMAGSQGTPNLHLQRKGKLREETEMEWPRRATLYLSTLTVKGRTHIKGWQSCGKAETCTEVIGRSPMNLLRSTSRQCYRQEEPKCSGWGCDWKVTTAKVSTNHSFEKNSVTQERREWTQRRDAPERMTFWAVVLICWRRTQQPGRGWNFSAANQ